MHEYAIVRALIERVEAEARARGAIAVRRIHVTIGELAGVEPDLLATAFHWCREDTACRDAGLEIHRAQARWTCSECGTIIPRGKVLRCGACRSPAQLTGGGEIVLDRIDMEVP